jgi:hypothetical protein
MPRAKALKVKVEDRPGMLGEVASALGAKGINVRGMQGWSEDGRGVLCFVVDRLAAASKLLRARGLSPDEEEVVEVQLPDKPGALGDVTKRLGDAGVNIRYVFVGPAGGKRATVFLAVSDVSAAMKALR